MEKRRLHFLAIAVGIGGIGSQKPSLAMLANNMTPEVFNPDLQPPPTSRTLLDKIGWIRHLETSWTPGVADDPYCAALSYKG
jgi:hypothetical protein